MCRKTGTFKRQKLHTARCSKCGFTLVELCVVLALLAILGTMIVSFSVLLNGFAAQNRLEYGFLEDHAKLKESLTAWAAEKDGPDSVFSIAGDGTMTVTENGTERIVLFAEGTLFLGGDETLELDAIDGVVFTANEKLIKCVTYRIGTSGEPIECSFVFFVRSGGIGEVAGNE